MTSLSHTLRLALRALLAAALMLAGTAGWAHKASDSYYRLDVQGDAVTGQLDVALRDIDIALGLDADGNGEITWGELRTRRTALADWARQHLAVQRGGDCTLEVGALQVDEHTDGRYAVLPLSGRCPGAAGPLTLGYRLLFQEDALHRGLLSLTLDDAITRTAVFAPETPQQSFEPGAVSRWTSFRQYVVEGVWHIWIGFDHVLFLLALLLPAVLVRDGRQWRGAPRLRQTGREVLAVVTAFTVAHSITLSLATLGWATLPSRWVESVIALSVILAAANNLYPVVQGRRWAAVFGFGLIHGFGFATVLADLGLPQQALALALLGFNVGVELGQLAIVAAFLPLAYALRNTPLYQRWIFRGGSWLTLLLAAVWLAERVLDLRLITN